jgi:hypothetical protein
MRKIPKEIIGESTTEMMGIIQSTSRFQRGRTRGCNYRYRSCDFEEGGFDTLVRPLTARSSSAPTMSAQQGRMLAVL